MPGRLQRAGPRHGILLSAGERGGRPEVTTGNAFFSHQLIEECARCTFRHHTIFMITRSAPTFRLFPDTGSEADHLQSCSTTPSSFAGWVRLRPNGTGHACAAYLRLGPGFAPECLRNSQALSVEQGSARRRLGCFSWGNVVRKPRGAVSARNRSPAALSFAEPAACRSFVEPAPCR